MISNTHHAKRTTRKESRQLRTSEIRTIRTTHGMAARIARAGTFRTAYVAAVVMGRRPASEKFLIAMQGVMLEDAQDRTTVAMLSGLPERQEAR